jgi:outer membrane protein assembly factor BamB
MKNTLFQAVFASAFIVLIAVSMFGAVDFGFADTAVSDDWSMLQHDMVRSGFSSSTAPNSNATLWGFQVQCARSSPAVVDGRLYIGSIQGKIYCLNSTTGVLIWSFNTNQTDQYSVPCVMNGKMYIGVGAVAYCFNASSGSLIWNFTTGSGVMGSCPAVVDDRVYIGSPDKNMYCLDEATGTPIWNYSTGSFVWSSPLVANGVVYFGSHDYNV